MSWRGIVAVTVALALTAAIALLVVVYREDFSERSVAAALLVLSFVVFTISGILYTGRAIWQWPVGQTRPYLSWERSFVIAALLATVLGLMLLEDLIGSAGRSDVALLGTGTYMLGAAVVLIAETTFIRKQEWLYSQVVVYVAMAFLAQTIIGFALLESGLVSAPIAWLVIGWNLACPVALLAFSRRDLYFPVLHHVAPMLIGIALLTSS